MIFRLAGGEAGGGLSRPPVPPPVLAPEPEPAPEPELAPEPRPARSGRGFRLSPRGRRLAALLGRPADVRIRRAAAPAAGREGWVEASVRTAPDGSAVLDMLALGAEVEVLHPAELRAQVRETARKLAALHSDDGQATRPR